MPQGMTGFGRATVTHESGAVTVEVKTVNNRFLKVAMRLPDVLAELESGLEARIRERLARGSVYCVAQRERGAGESSWRLDEELLRDWLPRLVRLASELKTEPPKLADLLSMDGIAIEESARPALDDALKTAVFEALDKALDSVVEMRAREGESLMRDLAQRVEKVAALTKEVVTRAPKVVEEYRGKLRTRIERLLKDATVELEPESLAREVASFADRADVTEETIRLAHHCEEFVKGLKAKGEVGRRLDFVAQEMLRETNTIGSKANDAELASLVVEMKSEIEKVKEQVQNIE